MRYEPIGRYARSLLVSLLPGDKLPSRWYIWSTRCHLEIQPYRRAVLNGKPDDTVVGSLMLG